jgi:hypothetical protein
MSALPRTATAKADMRKWSCPLYPESGHVRCTNACLLWAKSGHQRTSSEAVLLVFRGPCCKPFNASAIALSRLGWRSVAASMTARNGLSFSEITLRRVALVVIVNPRLKRLVTCVCRAAAAPAHRFSQARHRYKRGRGDIRPIPSACRTGVALKQPQRGEQKMNKQWEDERRRI